MLNKIITKIFTVLDDLRQTAYVKICVEKGLKLGNNVSIRNKASFGSEPFLVQIGDDSRIGEGVQFVTHSGFTVNLRKIEGYEKVRNFGHIKVGKNCAIGNYSIILQNVEIGDNCVLGANSVLSESMPSNTVYLGNPAKYVCEIEDYGDVLKKTTIDYPIELEQDRNTLHDWLKKNLPEKYKPAQ